MKSLEKDRDHRQPTAGELIGELEAIRPEVVPDSKFGLGERMMTLSSRPTAVDVRPTITGRTGSGTTPATRSGSTTPATRSGATTPGPRPTLTPSTPSRGTRTPPTRAGSSDATIVETRPTMGSDEATIAERRDELAQSSTLVDRVPASDSATIMEPRPAPAVRPVPEVERPKSKAGLFIAIAAVLIIAVGAAIFIKMRPGKVEPPVGPGPGPGTTEKVTTTATPLGDAATLNIAAFGTIREIKNLDTNQAVKINDDELQTPTQVYLAPGRYSVEIEGMNGEVRPAKNIQLSAKQRESLTWDEVPDLDSVANDVLSKEVAQ
jgi:hypothetical protein